MIKLVLTALPLASIVIGRLKRRIATSIVAGLFALMAVFWGSVAGFLALVPLWGGPAAAGAVAGGFLFIALVVWLIGRRRGPKAMGLPAASTASMAATTGAVAGASSPTLLAALLAGYMAGRGR